MDFTGKSPAGSSVVYVPGKSCVTLDCLNCHSATDAQTCRPAHFGREQLICGFAVIVSSSVGLIGRDDSAGAPQNGQSNKGVDCTDEGAFSAS